MSLARLARLAAVALFAYAVYRVKNAGAQDAGQGGAGGWLGESMDVLNAATEDLLSYVPISWSLAMWNPDKVPAQYRGAIATAERTNNLPDGMLGRLLYQESRFRPEIIDGRVTSSAGAIGIAQFMPATARELGVDPRDPFQSIAGAGRYLARLYRSTGSWDQALASYNWGIGNVQRRGLAAAPAETRNYFSQILADLGLTGGAHA